VTLLLKLWSGWLVSVGASRNAFSSLSDGLGLGDYEVRSQDGLASPHGSGFGGVALFYPSCVLKLKAWENFLLPPFFGSRRGWLSGCVQSGPWTLVRLSLTELRRWVWRLLFPRIWSLESILHWSFWRRTHQAVARYYHYCKRAQAP
jgi:hypothetical protein